MQRASIRGSRQIKLEKSKANEVRLKLYRRNVMARGFALFVNDDSSSSQTSYNKE